MAEIVDTDVDLTDSFDPREALYPSRDEEPRPVPFRPFQDYVRRAGPWVGSLVLEGRLATFRLTEIEFVYLLELAFANGWRPCGTARDRRTHLDGRPIEGYGDAGGRYDCAQGQVVGDEDANEIRSSLSRALVDPLGRLKVRGRRLVEDFVYFLDRGAFAIT